MCGVTSHHGIYLVLIPHLTEIPHLIEQTFMYEAYSIIHQLVAYYILFFLLFMWVKMEQIPLDDFEDS